MKKLLLAIILFASISANSQILISILLGDKLNSDGLEFGLQGGLNFTKIDGLETTKYSRKWNLGFYFDIRLKNQWFLYTGVLVKSNFGVSDLTYNDLNNLNAKIYYEDDAQTIKREGEYSQKINAFMVPILVRYKFKNHIYIELGPQASLMYNSWIQFDSEYDNNEAIIKEYNTKQINKIEAGGMIGLGYTLLKGTGWTFGANYYYGFTNVYSDIKGSNNSSFFLKVNIPIGAGKPTESE
jgi:hypothetical protein